jgi:hypothetical protein
MESLKANKNKFTNFKDIIEQRLGDKDSLFIVKYKNCKDFKNLILEMMNSNYTQDNLFHHFFNFWINLDSENGAKINY